MNRFEYLLNKLQEESGELTTAAAKVNAFGREGQDPSTGIYYDNVERLIKEANDVIGILQMLADEGFLPDGFIRWNEVYDKANKVNRYIRYHGMNNV